MDMAVFGELMSRFVPALCQQRGCTGLNYIIGARHRPKHNVHYLTDVYVSCGPGLLSCNPAFPGESKSEPAARAVRPHDKRD